MSYNFRPAVASEAKPLVGLYAESGKGKTYSALLLAKGFAGDMTKVAMLETEAGRGEAFADDPAVAGYQVLPLRESFAPKVYGEAISAAERAGFRALIIDSASHEWEGVGGVLAQAASNQADGKKGVLVWQQPKISHQRDFVGRLLQTPIPLVIVCMRAKYPMKEADANDVEKARAAGKRPPNKGDWIRSDKLEPKQSDDILYEMFVHGWLDDAHRFHGTKYTTVAMRSVFVDGEPISVETGQRLAAWADGRKSAPQERPQAARPGGAHFASPSSPAAADPGADEALLIRAREFAECGVEKYADFWKGLDPSQRRAIGETRHAEFKRLAGGA